MIARYMHWLHTRWPAGRVEKLPEVREDGTTALLGVRVVGDLTGIPLLKFSADTGARAVQAILREPEFGHPRQDGDADLLDLVIVGGGVSGISAALEAQKAGLRFQVFEAVQPFSTIVNFPKAKPIYTYPTDMTPAGAMQLGAGVKEALLEELESQRQAAGIGAGAAQHFLSVFSRQMDKPVRGFSPEVTQVFLDHPWPGNVRELENVVQRAALTTAHGTIGPEALPERMRGGRAEARPVAAEPAGEECPFATLDEVIQRHVRRVLEHTGGNRTRAARILGISRRTILRMEGRRTDGQERDN